MSPLAHPKKRAIVALGALLLLWAALAVCGCARLDAPLTTSDALQESSNDESSNAQTPSSQNTAPPESNGQGDLVARFLDVGQGDATLITCDDHALLIDGGPPKASNTIYAVLERLGIDHLDYLIATHPDSDHIGGLSGALSKASVDHVYCSTDTSDTSRFTTFLQSAKDAGSPIEIPATGTTLPLGGATVRFVGPVTKSGNDNDDSLVVRVEYGSTAMLFMGDAQMGAEETLLEANAPIQANVIKIGHHGSKSSSSAFFLQAVDPTYAVISVGKNSYGHPSKTVLDVLGSLGIETLRTDQLGDITIVSNGTQVFVEDR